MNKLDSYIKKLKKLNRSNTKYGKAPHKPILLITIIELIEKSIITDNKVFITPDIITSFRDNWDLLVKTKNVPDFTLPFFHLKGDKIWKSFLIDGSEQKQYIGGFNKFKSIVDYGKIDIELYFILENRESRLILLMQLLEYYFPETKQNYINKQENEFVKNIERDILNSESKNENIEDEEVIYVRNSTFKKVIPQIYNFTCAITGMRVQDIKGYNYIDACHIIPFRVSHDDKINNGIALNPLMHRLFDKHLISIDTNYRILISNKFEENLQSPFNLKQFEGKTINLPFGESYYPSLDNLKLHREKFYNSIKKT